MRTKLNKLIDRSSFVGRFLSDGFEKTFKASLLKSNKDQMLSINQLKGEMYLSRLCLQLRYCDQSSLNALSAKQMGSEELSASKISTTLRIKLTVFEQTLFAGFYI